MIGASIFSFAQDNTAESVTETTKTEIKIGGKVGYSLGSLTSNTENIFTDNYESISGIDFGLTFEFKLTALISMQTELNYTNRGGERNGLQPVTANELSETLNSLYPFTGLPLITNANPLYATFDSESDLQYLEVPALVKFSWGDNLRFSAAIGPYVGIFLKPYDALASKNNSPVSLSFLLIPIAKVPPKLTVFKSSLIFVLASSD